MLVMGLTFLLCFPIVHHVSSDFQLQNNEKDSTIVPVNVERPNPLPSLRPSPGYVKDEYHQIRVELHQAAANDPCVTLGSRSRDYEIRTANRLCSDTLEKFKLLPDEEKKNCQDPIKPECIPHKEKISRWRSKTVYDCCYQVVFKATESSRPSSRFKSTIRDCFANIKWDIFVFGPRPGSSARFSSNKSTSLSDRALMFILCIKDPRKKAAIYSDPVFKGRIGQRSMSYKNSRGGEDDAF